MWTGMVYGCGEVDGARVVVGGWGEDDGVRGHEDEVGRKVAGRRKRTRREEVGSNMRFTGRRGPEEKPQKRSKSPPRRANRTPREPTRRLQNEHRPGLQNCQATHERPRTGRRTHEAPKRPHNDWTLRAPDVHPAKREESTSGSDVLSGSVFRGCCNATYPVFPMIA